MMELDTLRDKVERAAKILKDRISIDADAFSSDFANVPWDNHLMTLLHHGDEYIHGDSISSKIKAAKKELLMHPVMRYVVSLGWRKFGLRKYCEQLFMHLLLLLTLTVSLGLSLGTATGPKFEKVFMFWLVCMSFLLLSLLATRFLTWKNKVPCAWLTLVLWYGVVAGVLIYYDTLLELLESQELPKASDLEWFGRINNILLGLSALYFCIFELREFAADMPDKDDRRDILGRWLCALDYMLTSIINLFKGDHPSPYLESYWNRIQLPTFFFVFVYVGCEFTAPFSDNMRVYAGIPAILLLWIMCVQYLEVFPAVGYLLPMMRRMLADVACYLVFYFPIQCAYSSAYYLLFKSQGDHLKPYEPEPAFASNFTSAMHRFFPGVDTSDNATTMALLTVLKTKDKSDMFLGYETMPKSFLTTYLVTFGQINLEPFDQLESPSAYVLGYLLLVTHATIVIVMLLSALIAMMNKTMGAHMDEAKLEACITFAECVSRMRKVDTITVSKIDWDNLGYQKLYDDTMADDKYDKIPSNQELLKAITDLTKVEAPAEGQARRRSAGGLV
ncbi:hypothetical protein SDRG_03784 [Saprolegnia diclina VS20]|uniref:Ion transport domain-containing protein n=1 Tax=Saprolegnia diclina (strain VS20) TaxID=1156394 RepID=T0QVW9_SAPDV|nr:hypothetical protein SDRG_03784 [Saprolegnia diclina VS20]EQC38826.1 hypothetical protein SDRG_03784 [Saprolegnia diclina VS20]|eukprot:XP_008607650.1 hypothetical protein SDRG_03784 [Saprolegnia diclina VS20]